MWRKRLTAMLLVCVMVLTGLPQAAISVSADDGDITLPEVGAEGTWSATFHGNGYVDEDGKSEWIYHFDYGETPISPGGIREYQEKIFSGWYWDQACTDPAEDLYDTAFDRNIELWAGWADYYTVTYDLTEAQWKNYETDSYVTSNIVCRVPKGMAEYKTPDNDSGIYHLEYTGDESGTHNPAFYADAARTEELENFDPYSFVPEEDITIYVGWKRYIRVTFDANGGYLSRYTYDGEVVTQEEATEEYPWEEDGVHIDFSYRAAKNDDENLIFSGWYYDAACKSPVPTELVVYEDLTVYAGWTSEYVTVTFDASPGGFFVDKEDGSQEWVQGKLAVKAAPDVPLGQYTRFFNIEYDESGDSPWYDEGWYLESDFSGERIFLDEFSVNEDTTLYMKWEKIIQVRFHANGGSFASEDDDGDGIWTAGLGEDDEFFRYRGPAITPPSGKGFSGWYTDKEAKKDRIDPEEYTFTGNTDLYAGWTENCHTVTLVLPEDGAWTDYMDQPHTENPVIYVGDGLTLEEVPCRQVWEDISYVGDKGGSRQIQWFTEKEHGPYDSVNPGTISPTENMTLYGEWMIHYTVTFDANGGYFGDPTETEEDWYFQSGKGTMTQNRNAQWQDDSLVFEAWYLDKACTQKLDYATYDLQSDIRLYAKYVEPAIITVNANGGLLWNGKKEEWTDQDIIFRTSPGSHIYAYPIPSVKPAADAGRKVFAGWSTVKDDPASLVNFDKYIIEKDATLYALWEDGWLITFDLNGGKRPVEEGETGDPLTVACRKGGSLIEVYPEIRCSKTEDGVDYIFYEWSEDKEGKKIITDYRSFVPSGDTTLYAQYKRQRQITFHANGGRFYTAPASQPDVLTRETAEGQPLGIYDLTTNVNGQMVNENANMAFAGWAEDPAGEKMVTDIADRIVTADTDYYAIWKEGRKVRSITLTPETVRIRVGETAQLTPVISPANAVNKTVYYSASSYAGAVASVTQDGLVTGLKVGTAGVDGISEDGVHYGMSSVRVEFDDVRDDKYYAYGPIYWAVSMGITSGTKPNLFSVKDPCTRAQAVTFLWRAAGSPLPHQTKNPFTDVAKDKYYYNAVLWAVEKGITKGTSNTAFSPNAPCTRAQIVTFLSRFLNGGKTDTANPFKDVAESSYYYDSVMWAVSKEITSGTSTTTFAPNATCTRGQIVTFLYRANMAG